MPWTPTPVIIRFEADKEWSRIFCVRVCLGRREAMPPCSPGIGIWLSWNCSGCKAFGQFSAPPGLGSKWNISIGPASWQVEEWPSARFTLILEAQNIGWWPCLYCEKIGPWYFGSFLTVANNFALNFHLNGNINLWGLQRSLEGVCKYSSYLHGSECPRSQCKHTSKSLLS